MRKLVNKKTGKVMTSLWIHIDLKNQLDVIAEKEDRTIAWLINQMVREGLERRGKI